MKAQLPSYALLAFLLALPAYALELGEEKVPADEAAAIERANKITRKFLDERYRPLPAGEARRGVHPYAHGCVRARLKVHAQLPAWARAGIFQEGAEYRAWARFSNASPRPQADKKGDPRGVGLKIVGAKGPRVLTEDAGGHTLDFTMNSFPVFFARDAASYAEFIDSFLLKNQVTPYLFPKKLDPRTWRLREAKIFAGINAVKMDSPLNAAYYSITPFKHGNAAVKYRIQPCEGVKERPEPEKKGEHFLHDAMVRELGQGDVCLSFALQRQVDAEKMPIEDATELWDEKLSPFVQVATLTIPRQEFTSPKQAEFCENLTINPWRTHPDHRPLGGVNRMRLSNYQLSNEIRHELNRVAPAEPSESGEL
jgi:catalase